MDSERLGCIGTDLECDVSGDASSGSERASAVVHRASVEHDRASGKDGGACVRKVFVSCVLPCQGRGDDSVSEREKEWRKRGHWG